MTSKKGKFKDSGKKILTTNRPKNMADFLGDGQNKTLQPPTTISSEKKKDERAVDTALRNDVNTPQAVKKTFFLESGLNEKLRLYVFKNRTTERAVITEALDRFFAEMGNDL